MKVDKKREKRYQTVVAALPVVWTDERVSSLAGFPARLALLEGMVDGEVLFYVRPVDEGASRADPSYAWGRAPVDSLFEIDRAVVKVIELWKRDCLPAVRALGG